MKSSEEIENDPNISSAGCQGAEGSVFQSRTDVRHHGRTADRSCCHVRAGWPLRGAGRRAGRRPRLSCYRLRLDRKLVLNRIRGTGGRDLDRDRALHSAPWDLDESPWRSGFSIERDLRANATRLSRGKTATHSSGSCSRGRSKSRAGPTSALSYMQRLKILIRQPCELRAWAVAVAVFFSVIPFSFIPARLG